MKKIILQHEVYDKYINFNNVNTSELVTIFTTDGDIISGYLYKDKYILRIDLDESSFRSGLDTDDALMGLGVNIENLLWDISEINNWEDVSEIQYDNIEDVYERR